MPSLPQDIARRSETFDREIESYRHGPYPEAQVHKELIAPPFFRAPGWDIDNEEGWAEAYKDVVRKH